MYTFGRCQYIEAFEWGMPVAYLERKAVVRRGPRVRLGSLSFRGCAV